MDDALDYQKKPLKIQAAKVEANNADRVAAWCDGYVVDDLRWDYEHGCYILHGGIHVSAKKAGLQPPRTVVVPTTDGYAFALPGDYVIRGVQGEYYPCDRRIFHQTYDRVPKGEW